MKPILITLALAACSMYAQAQPEGGGPPPGGPEGGPPPGGPQGMRRAPDPLMVALDANKNGELSPEEIASATAALKVLDKDADGKLTKEELRPARPPRGEGPGKPPHDGPPDGPPPGPPEGGRRPAPPVAAALDTDKNGEFSSEEIANASAALKTLDKDADGKLSKEELRPARPARGEGGAGGPGKGPGKPNRGGRPGADGPPPGR